MCDLCARLVLLGQTHEFLARISSMQSGGPHWPSEPLSRIHCSFLKSRPFHIFTCIDMRCNCLLVYFAGAVQQWR